MKKFQQTNAKNYKERENFNNWVNRTLHLNFEWTWDHFWIESFGPFIIKHCVSNFSRACKSKESQSTRDKIFLSIFWVDIKRLIKKIEIWLFVIARLSYAHILFLALNATWREKIRFVRNEMKMICCSNNRLPSNLEWTIKAWKYQHEIGNKSSSSSLNGTSKERDAIKNKEKNENWSEKKSGEDTKLTLTHREVLVSINSC